MIQLFLTIIFLCFSVVPTWAAEKESTFDRVMRTGTIRCGYLSAEPYFMKDANTEKLSGIWYEYVEEIGKELGLKIDWAEEVGLSDVSTALETNRIDSFCVGLWVNPLRAKVMDFVNPITYQIVDAYVRQDDYRFDKNPDKINDASITISCQDGEMAATIAQEDYPKAKTVCLPQLAPFSDMLMNVSQGKADVTFVSPAVVAQFNKTNAPKLRKIPMAYPVRTFPESIAVAKQADDFRRMLDHTTEFMLNSGKVEKIIEKYSMSSQDFIRIAKPYEVTK